MARHEFSKRDIRVEYGYQGQIICCAIINGYREHQQYFGYTKTKAVNKFYHEMKGAQK